MPWPISYIRPRLYMPAELPWLAEAAHRFGGVLRHALAVEIHDAEIVLGHRIALDRQRTPGGERAVIVGALEITGAVLQRVGRGSNRAQRQRREGENEGVTHS